MPDVFTFLDYRAFLRAFYASKKAAGRGFSFRSFARKAELRSPNYLKLVMDGQRALSAEMAARFASACGLEGERAEYFAELVSFNQARSATQRQASYERLSRFRAYRAAHRLELAQAAYHSTWYLPAVRELSGRRDFEATGSWIAARLRPKISEAEAERAVRVLLGLGLLERGRRGHVRRTSVTLTTGPETRGHHIATYHRTMLTRAIAAMDEVPAQDRDISSLTLCVGEGGLAALKARIQRFRKELLELEASDLDPREVVQVNMQLFPLTDCGKEDGR